MAVLDWLIGCLTPHECLGCGREGALLCALCSDLLPEIPNRCYRCRKVTKDSQTCQKCRKASRLAAVYVCTEYEGVAKDLIGRLKFSGAQAAARSIAQALAPLLTTHTVIVPVPTATSRVRRRGYDQAKLIAKRLARQTGLEYRDCLARLGQAHQVGASRQQRLKQLSGAYRIKRPLKANQTVLLVDDVLTTGATLEGAAATLKSAGIKRIEAIVFAQA